MLSSRLLRAVAVTSLGIVLTLALTYPIAPNIRSVARYDSGDGQWNVWNIAWVAHTVFRAPWDLYDANIFYPHEKVLAYSENNFGAGTLVAPVYLLTRDPILTHNVAVLLAFVFAFVATYALARYLTGSPAAAIVPAILFAFCPYMFSRMAHIQLLYTAGFPLCLLALHRFADRPSARRAAWLAAALVATALTCGYYGLFGGLIVALGVIYYAIARGLWRDRRYLAGVAGAALGSGLTVLAIFYPYLTVRQEGFVRSLEEAAMWAPTWRDYFVSSAWLHRWMWPYVDRWTEVLFPGYVSLALSAAGIVAVLGRSAAGGVDARGSRPPVRETAIFYVILGVFAFWMSLGPAAGLYSAVYQIFPPLGFLRGIGRVGVVVSLSLAILAGFAIERWIRGRKAAAIVAGIAALAVIDLNNAPIGQTPVPPVATAYKMLANMPRGPVVELPFFWIPNQRYQQAQYMMWSAWHWQPLINGYSDNSPPGFREAAQVIDSFPSPESFREMRDRGARYLVVHMDLYNPEGQARMIRALEDHSEYLVPLVREDNVWLFEIVAFP